MSTTMSTIMSKTMIDITIQRIRLLRDTSLLNQVPPELLEVIRSHSSANSTVNSTVNSTTCSSFLDAVAAAALIPKVTTQIFIHFESIFADICARWYLRSQTHRQEDRIIEAFARILPFAPHLAVFLERYIQETSTPTGDPTRPYQIDSLGLPDIWQSAGKELLTSLLSFWRLLNFDKGAFGPLVSPSQIQTLFQHSWPPIRFLAIKVFCLQLSASDYKLESLILKHIGDDVSLVADFDGVDVDYFLLSLFEQKRAKELDNFRRELQDSPSEVSAGAYPSQQATPLVVSYGSTLLPRPSGFPKLPSSLVNTPTTVTNLEGLAQNFQKAGPILLYGLPGSGKTSLVHELARELGMDSSLVTLHLNEQTDAKMLIGLYSTDSRPGSFSWRPGVLTTAVKEGRWVLIEDLDRAPNEVMSTLLPLVERGELLVASRGEKIQAASTFRLFATVRTSRGMDGQESLPTFLGQRFWRQQSIKTNSDAELESIINGNYPLLRMYTPMIMSVYGSLTLLPGLRHTTRSASDRQITPRDLFKWCHRLQELLVAVGCKTGKESVSETTRGCMFMEAVDCFCGSLSKEETRSVLVGSIAKEMHLPEQVTAHYIKAHIPQIEDTREAFRVGRVTLSKRKHLNRIAKSKRPFASTTHSKRLLEQISVAVKLREPVLLVGETGIGKTTVVQQLADLLGHKLTAVNLSQQSEVGDLLGGFKPVNARTLAIPLKEEFESLFTSTGISTSRNQKYLEQLGKCTAKGQWPRVSKLWREAPKMFNNILNELQRRREISNKGNGEGVGDDGQPATKRRKTDSKLQSLLDLKPRWEAFARSLEEFDTQISGASGSFAFTFVEGNIVKAVRNGDWVLLDEVNLASPDTLESIADLLTSGLNNEPSILLSETGEIERISAHPDFRIFGAMNPATDIGKRDLPPGLRSRFTEFHVGSPDGDIKDLLTIVKAYMSGKSAKDEQAADDIARLYLNTKARAEEKRLVDGANEVPHYSLRTLTRVLSYVNEIAPYYGLRRALYEGFSMGFLTLLDRASEATLVPLIHHYLLDRHGGAKSLLSQPPKHPNDGKQYVKFTNRDKDRQYWLLRGCEPPLERTDYVITPYVERNLLSLVRATSTRRFPILIQGPTSAGKTSMIEYLANYSGNKFVRINNHEHTDLQEYLGTYVSDSNGKLRFQEGLLVQALRLGHWIVLDELNLAPTDVLEALNRLLDDNRELLIPETQEVVRPHESFMLFATQNPPGLYGGRKALSRAFRNRFLELHFDDIPEDELETILQQRSIYTAPSDCKRIVNVYKELSRLRQSSRLFENKESFATLRDLFRWALRGAETREEIAANGFMLLAERVRNQEERMAVKKVIETIFKVKVDPDQLYDPQRSPSLARVSHDNRQGIVWTYAMRRLYTLVASALRHNEPVLLVGETGCGKTSLCQILAESFGKDLYIVNAHQNTETGDLIGSQRPIRNRGGLISTLLDDVVKALHTLGRNTDGTLDELLQSYHALDVHTLSRIPSDLQNRILGNEVRSKALFEWTDGSLVHAMRDGQFFLLDEISLADDSVLERLNSVLEPHRSLLLAEKGIVDSFVSASDGFQFLATMNPGGDFGKKELSPALRNRFTEIWVPPLSENEDVLLIVRSKLKEELRHLSDIIVEFSYWFGQNFRSTSSTAFSIRDILVWVKFVNESTSDDDAFSIVHGASTVFIDTLGANPSALISTDPKRLDVQRQACLDKLSELLGSDAAVIYRAPLHLHISQEYITVGDFSIQRATGHDPELGFALHAPTTKRNAMRIIRALQVQKPILLEGSPGVGKTTLVASLARACGRPLTRINLSDQTDLMDLFGTDVPVEGAEAGSFAWRDAPFLRAMQNGEWVLLDEMNLASQSVLEGLNACLDHRGEVYVSELDRVFKRHPDFRLFAAQNPHHQGGGRKGLPSSFVNRFIVVYADVFTDEDLLLIAQHNFPTVPTDTMKQTIQFISKLEERIVADRSFGSQGSPWEFNLRDILRWLNLFTSTDPLLGTASIDDLLDIVIRQRFRSQTDKLEVDKLFATAFGAPPREHQIFHNCSSRSFQVGLVLLRRNQLTRPSCFPCVDLRGRLSELESLLICIKQNIPCILVGPSGCGKSTLLQYVAALAGERLVTFPMNADIDTMDLVGGFEQSDPSRKVNVALKELQESLQLLSSDMLPELVPSAAMDLLSAIETHDGDSSRLRSLWRLVRNLRTHVTADTKLATILAEVEDLTNQSATITDPRFEWLDSIIVQALQKGQWLVLDNANLCSASVLDRLNSLLEPDGSLIVNEHCGPNGEPRLVRPHPNFRVFLTVDPRYGELSRAMRNRAIEIYIEPRDSRLPPWRQTMVGIEPGLQRYESLPEAMHLEVACSTDTSQIATDSLSLADFSLLEKYRDYDIPVAVRQASSSSDQELVFNKTIDRATSFAKSSLTSGLRSAIHILYTSLPEPLFPGISSMQPSHPLHNSVIVPLLQDQSPNLPFWLAACYELYQNIIRSHNALESQKPQFGGLQMSGLSRLQRSYMRDNVAAVSKDSTVGAARFLVGMLQAVESYLRAQLQSPSRWKQRKSLLRILMHSWWTLFSYLSDTRFQEAQFQARLSHVSNVLNSKLQVTDEEDACDLISLVLRGLNECFTTGFKLTTGLEMERLWIILKPLPITSSPLLEHIGRIEQLASRFDALKWRSAADLPGLVTITTSFAETYTLLRHERCDADELLKVVDHEIGLLDKHSDRTGAPPFLLNEFEIIRQIVSLDHMTRPRESPQVCSELALLSGLSLTTQMRIQSASSTSRPLQSIGYLLGDSSSCYAWKSSFSVNVLPKLDAIASVTLDRLHLLETELPVMARHVSASMQAIADDPFDRLSEVLWGIMSSIATVYDPIFSALFAQARTVSATNVSYKFASIGSQGLSFDLHKLPLSTKYDDLAEFPEVVSQHLFPALVSLLAYKTQPGRQSIYLGNAWLQFSIAIIKLFVPDKPHDPQLRPQVELQSYEEMVRDLSNHLRALRKYEAMRTGRDTNLRCVLLEEEILAVGERPNITQSVYRPADSQLSKVQGEFGNLLKTILDVDIASLFSQRFFGSEDASQQIAVIQANISQIIDRLSSGFGAYEDIMVPTVNMLHCLQIGFSLGDPTLDRAGIAAPLGSLISLTPFLGGKLDASVSTETPVKSFEFLEYIAARVSVEGPSVLTSSISQSIFEAIHLFYDEWRQKLDTDRKAEEAKQRTYRYRGGLDEEEAATEQAFNEMFPRFDGNDDGDASPDPQPSSDQASSARVFSIKLARAHKRIFLSPQDAGGAIRNLSVMVARAVSEKRGGIAADRDMLSATMLVLEDRMHDIQAQTTTTSYNFYTDRNLPEIRRLVKLVHDLRTKFRQLQQIDEIGHMQPLADVVATCGKVLEFSYSDPLAKIIPRVEQLHAFVYEWQFGGWASKTHGVLSLHNRLTEMLVGWRRLELSTWAKMLDMEAEKSYDDASAWWFVAYQAVIAEPLVLAQDKQDLRTHAIKLLQELGSYFATATVGQFIGRLDLLRQLQKQLEVISTYYPTMSAIHQALSNFIVFYSRYEPAVIESIRASRAPIEKQMKDILLLASWKDTNITALRESARKSHQKLFKTVRKFHEVLGQPMNSIIDSGLPDEKTAEAPSVNTSMETAKVDAAASVRCQKGIKSWRSNYKRLCNIRRTIGIMSRLSHTPDGTIDAVYVIDDFICNLISSVCELRKETPTVLTEENKSLVKHLKTRKRKLLADTLRDIRRMGFKHNLSTDVLATQSSLSAVLATSGAFAPDTTAGISDAEYFFHRILDLAPRARNAIQGHSDDLTTAEVDRSIGLIEGILHVVSGQRRDLEKLYRDHTALSERLFQLQVIAQSSEDSPILVHEHTGNPRRAAAWLVQIIQVGIHLINLHARFGGIDNKHIIIHLSTYLERVRRLLAELESLPSLPQGLISSKGIQLKDEIEALLTDFRASLDDLCCSRRDLEFVLKQIQLWTETSNDMGLHVDPTMCEVIALAESSKTLCDSILVAIELFSRSNSELPSSHDEAGWLLSYNRCLTTSAHALQINKVNKSIDVMLDTFKTLDLGHTATNNVAASLIGVVVSIVDQYRITCAQSIDTLSRLYQKTCKLGYIASKNFTQLASEGFCTPQERSDETSGESNQIEGGTGLGDGEGAEDISKDVQPDEDLTEIAQEGNQGPKSDTQDEKDAVDMADEDLEGDLESVDGAEDELESNSGDDDERDEMDEETGDVDDLDPSAVDEKLWDGKNEDEADKDQQGNSTKGNKKPDEQTATEQNATNQEASPEDNDDQGDDASVDNPGAEQDEDVQLQEEDNRQDQRAQEEDTLALPDDMDIDLNDNQSTSTIKDDDLDNLSDANEQEMDDEEEAVDGADRDDDSDDAVGEVQETAAQDSTAEANIDKDQEDDAKTREDQHLDDSGGEHEDLSGEPSVKNSHSAANDIAPDEVKDGAENQGSNQHNGDDSQGKDDQPDQGQLGEKPADKAKATGEKGDMAQDQNEPTQSTPDDPADSATEQAFKSLGDAFKKWHRQQRDIQKAREETSDERGSGLEQELTAQEYQHLQNDESAADTQALGTATEDQKQRIDDAMAIDDIDKPTSDRVAPEDVVEDNIDNDRMDDSEEIDKPEQDFSRDENRAGASIRQGGHQRNSTPPVDGKIEMEQVEETIHETSRRLSSTHISEASLQLRGFDESMEQWTAFQAKTHPISLALTSQLRLILIPSQTTKLSGSYRTGKRLNIKRIIPYIASGYKRDKIWMRRTIPTKRSYQILLCVDDSRSMGESSSGQLALESLVMVSRALTMLEVGQVGVLGFGANTFMAHEFSDPFASHEAGAKVLQRFSFQQDYTDVQLVIKQVIRRFQSARQQRTSHGSEDLWQLALILSDGLTPSSAHGDIQVLLREALEERIMIVFIIMDNTLNGSSQSVLNLKKVKFSGNDEVHTEYYLDSFPFQYYLIVHNLEDLPGALAGLLRTWFAEVNS